MTARIDRRKEGLEALASMISECTADLRRDASCGPDQKIVDIDPIPTAKSPVVMNRQNQARDLSIGNREYRTLFTKQNTKEYQRKSNT
jgi:hypothetical protein